MKTFLSWINDGWTLALLLAMGTVGFLLSSALQTSMDETMWRALSTIATLGAVVTALLISLHQRENQIKDRTRSELRQDLRDAISARASLIHFYSPLLRTAHIVKLLADRIEKLLASTHADLDAYAGFRIIQNHFTMEMPTQIVDALPTIGLLGNDIASVVSLHASAYASNKNAYDTVVKNGEAMAKFGNFRSTLIINLDALRKYEKAVSQFPALVRTVHDGSDVARLQAILDNEANR